LVVLKNLIIKPEILLFLYFFAVGSFSINFYPGVVEDQLAYVGASPDLITNLITIQGYLFPCVFIISPFLGIAMKYLRLIPSLFVCQGLAIAFVTLRAIKNPYVQIATFIVFAILRTWFFSVSTFFVVKFANSSHFGKMWGVAEFVIGLIHFLQYPLLAAIYSFNNNWLYYDIGNGVLYLIGFIFPIYLLIQQKKRRRKRRLELRKRQKIFRSKSLAALQKKKLYKDESRPNFSSRSRGRDDEPPTSKKFSSKSKASPGIPGISAPAKPGQSKMSRAKTLGSLYAQRHSPSNYF